MILSNPPLFTISPPPKNQIRNPNPSPNFSSSQLSSLSRPTFQRRCWRSGDSEWDSNAESFRFRFRDEEDGEFGESGNRCRRWWSDEFDDGFDLFDEESESFWDKFWIFKERINVLGSWQSDSDFTYTKVEVFKAYGYLLPAIIASMLLGTGPQAFFMALALPLGQLAISLAIEKLWGRASEGPKTRPRTKGKPFSRSSTNFRKQDEEEKSSDYKGKDCYQSWVSADPKVTSRTNRSWSTFGGWDEFDNQTEPMRRKWPTETVKNGKLSKRGRYRDVPLLLRLLIAIFPFLGSWTRIL